MKWLWVLLLLCVAAYGETYIVQPPIVCVSPPTMPSVLDYQGMQRTQHWMAEELRHESYRVVACEEPHDYVVWAYQLHGGSTVLGINYAVIGPSPRIGTIYAWPERFSVPGSWTVLVKREGWVTPVAELHGSSLNKRLMKRTMRRFDKSIAAETVSKK